MTSYVQYHDGEDGIIQGTVHVLKISDLPSHPTVTPTELNRERILIGVDSTTNGLKSYRLDIQQLRDLLDIPAADAGVVIGVGATLPIASMYATGRLFLLHSQADSDESGWYEARGTAPNLYWVQRTHANLAG